MQKGRRATSPVPCPPPSWTAALLLLALVVVVVLVVMSEGPSDRHLSLTCLTFDALAVLEVDLPHSFGEHKVRILPM